MSPKSNAEIPDVNGCELQYRVVALEMKLQLEEGENKHARDVLQAVTIRL